MGGSAEEAVKRIARIADGWFTFSQPDGDGPERLARFHGYLREAGRDPATFPIEGRVVFAKRTPDEWVSRANAFRAMGMTHLEVNTMGAGYATLGDHLKALEIFRRDAAALFE